VRLLPDDLVGEQIERGETAVRADEEPRRGRVRRDAADAFRARASGWRPRRNAFDELVSVIHVEDENPDAAVIRRVPDAGDGDVEIMLNLPRPSRPTRPTCPTRPARLLSKHLHDRRGDLAGVGK